MRTLLTLLLAFTLFAASCGDDGGSAAAWCDLATEVDALDELGGQDPDDWRRFQDLLQDAVDAAPGEISDDVQLTADFLDDIVDALDDNDDNLLLAIDQATTSDDYDQAALDAAGDRIEAYNEAECGIGSSDDDGSDDGSTDADSSTDGDDSSDDGDDGGLPEGGIVAGIADSLGIPEEDARCILENVDIGPGGEPDPTQIFDAPQHLRHRPVEHRLGGRVERTAAGRATTISRCCPSRPGAEQQAEPRHRSQ